MSRKKVDTVIIELTLEKGQEMLLERLLAIGVDLGLKITKDNVKVVQRALPFEFIVPKITRLKTDLQKLGFEGLNMIKALNEEQKDAIYRLINENDEAFQIALLLHVGFVEHLEVELKVKEKVHKLLAAVLQSEQRSIRGNINSCGANCSNREKERFKAYQYCNTVREQFDKVKNRGRKL